VAPVGFAAARAAELPDTLASGALDLSAGGSLHPFGGRYRFVRLLHAGSSALVVEAYDTLRSCMPEASPRAGQLAPARVVLKIFHAHKHAVGVEEARVLASLAAAATHNACTGSVHVPMPRIVRMHGCITVGSAHLCLVLDRLAEDAVRSALAPAPQLRRDAHVARLRKMAIQLAGALAHVHDCGFVHSQLRPQHVVFDKAATHTSMALHLVDFSAACASGTTRIMPPGADWTYASPEALAAQPLSPASDMWSLGIVLSEAALRGPVWTPREGAPCADRWSAFEAACLNDLGSTPQTAGGDAPPGGHVPRCRLLDQLNSVDSGLAHLVSRLLRFTPEERLTARQVLSHAFVVALNCHVPGHAAPSSGSTFVQLLPRGSLIVPMGRVREDGAVQKDAFGASAPSPGQGAAAICSAPLPHTPAMEAPSVSGDASPVPHSTPGTEEENDGGALLLPPCHTFPDGTATPVPPRPASSADTPSGPSPAAVTLDAAALIVDALVQDFNQAESGLHPATRLTPRRLRSPHQKNAPPPLMMAFPGAPAPATAPSAPITTARTRAVPSRSAAIQPLAPSSTVARVDLSDMDVDPPSARATGCVADAQTKGKAQNGARRASMPATLGKRTRASTDDELAVRADSVGHAVSAGRAAKKAKAAEHEATEQQKDRVQGGSKARSIPPTIPPHLAPSSGKRERKGAVPWWVVTAPQV